MGYYTISGLNINIGSLRVAFEDDYFRNRVLMGSASVFLSLQVRLLLGVTYQPVLPERDQESFLSLRPTYSIFW